MQLGPVTSPSDRAQAHLPPLPVPNRTRFQPLRLGLVELFHYDAEEFWFRDGHLLLRGNNGTGKSKVLSLTLPFLLDASLSPSRVEPDGDRTKRMEWNLLMGRHERRVGYSWIEFGRLGEGDVPEYVTLGCGLRAIAGRPRVDSWHFITPQRIGQELSLITPERTALSRERLTEALAGSGQLFDTARDYRLAVDARLFRLGERYDALVDTLIQLRQPQLSKKPDENSLSSALSSAMPELPRPVLEDVAEAMNQLDAYRAELAHVEHVRAAVNQFGRRYRIYAQIQARRQARVLRQAQSEFEKHSQLVNEARSELGRAEESAQLQHGRVEQLEASLRAERARLDELRADPSMSDARRLSDLDAAVKSAVRERQKAGERLSDAKAQLAREQHEQERRAEELARLRARCAHAQAACLREAAAAGLAEEHAAREQSGADTPAANTDFAPLERELVALAARRGAQVAQLRRRFAALEQEERLREACATRSHVHRGLCERAEQEARRSRQALDAAAAALRDAWREYAAQLAVLVLHDVEGGLNALEEWTETLAFEQPMRARIDAAQRDAETTLARQSGALELERAALDQDEEALNAELAALHRGEQSEPLCLPTRDPRTRHDRAGAPFWRLFEFLPDVPADERAGLEAALEASGLLDAWVTPEGALLAPDTHDAWLEVGAARPRSLKGWLIPTAGAVAEAKLHALLGGIACGEQDDDVEALTYLSPSGRFRIGTLHGAFHKPEPQYLGHAAREAERQRRIALLVMRGAALAEARQAWVARQALLAARREKLQAELAALPKDDPLLAAQARHSAEERQRREVLDALAGAEAELQRTEQRVRDARTQLASDARDLHLPEDAAQLALVEAALGAYANEVRALRHALEAAAGARLDLERHREREQRAREQAGECALEADSRAKELQEVEARHQLLLATAGAAVAELTRRISASNAAVKQSEQALEEARVLETRAREAVARNEQRLADGQLVMGERTSQRAHAVVRLSGFAATGLFALALPELELPNQTTWTVDPALTLARKAEQLLAAVAADDADWTRVQNEVSRDYTALGQALTALGQRAQMDQSDYGFVVQILYHGRAERPDVLERLLASEVEQRRGILSAREREVLENHLQAEVAACLVRLLREAEAQIERINTELKRRPTSTGVYFRLEWEPIQEDGESATSTLSAVRTRLLRRASEAWSGEDRRIIGAFLSGRIDAERARDETGPLVDHLTRALDYRAWHRFRVKRWHDGAFRPLSGPASSGERALGLTVPLFAAASSHYASGGSPHAPRLVLLDEAFAGIDDEARAHCMALIREFDLDFVMTSEREWGCYATLPGVSICHILRREGIDAAFVSRWSWDGAVRRAEGDPTRRFGVIAPLDSNHASGD